MKDLNDMNKSELINKCFDLIQLQKDIVGINTGTNLIISKDEYDKLKNADWVTENVSMSKSQEIYDLKIELSDALKDIQRLNNTNDRALNIIINLSEKIK